MSDVFNQRLLKTLKMQKDQLALMMDFQDSVWNDKWYVVHTFEHPKQRRTSPDLLNLYCFSQRDGYLSLLFKVSYIGNTVVCPF